MDPCFRVGVGPLVMRPCACGSAPEVSVRWSLSFFGFFDVRQEWSFAIFAWRSSQHPEGACVAVHVPPVVSRKQKDGKTESLKKAPFFIFYFLFF